MSSYHLNTSFNSLTITSKSSISTTTISTSHCLLDVDSHRLSISSAQNINVSGVSNHQRRTSIVNHHQRRNSQLRKASFTTSTLSLAVTDEEAGDLSGARLSISNSLTSVHKQCEQDDSEATNKLLEIGRVASWAVGFEKLLNDDAGLHIFTEFLKKEFSQENIQFWIACEKFKKLSDPEEIRHHANLIWSTYLHDTDDGSCPINIDSRTRQECQQSLLNKPHAHIFEKAQSQIFQLMKYDSYSRFLKSNMYKDCIMSEMEGKSIPFIKQQQQQQQQQTSSNYDERTKTLDSFAKLKDDEKKDKKRSPLLPWTKAFIKWKRLSATPETIKRDTPSSLSNLHHQTANASTNTPIHENLCLTPFLTSPITNKSASTELGTILTQTKLASASSSSSSLIIPTNSGNLSKTNQESTSFSEKKTLIENSPTLSIDTSRFCRFIFPDQTSAVVLTYNCTNVSIQKAINHLFAKRGFIWYRTELYSTSSNDQVRRTKKI
ncbi:unnamed protein product [Rotaria sordida]|uniref:RGS domain-containing protein n=1 Tax=Rotaria sordida TaxID=392033 RepID=A0A814AQC0_9BILA|nr:unnamed protein product [Rotaria sordida]